MSKNKKRNKKDKKRNNNTNNRNNPDNMDKENVPVNKENQHKKKFCFGQIIVEIMIALIAAVLGGVIVIFISRYFISPKHIDISTSQDELSENKDVSATSQDKSAEHEYKLSAIQDGFIGYIDQRDEKCKVYFMDSDRSLRIHIDNNSDMFMRITDIFVNVIKCTDITEEDTKIGEYKVSGDLKRPICLKTKIEHHTGKMEVEIDRKLNPEYDTIPYSYIIIPNNTSEKFILSMDFEKQGYYNIEVEFNYLYDGKQRTIRTNSLDCVFIEKNYNDSKLYQLESNSN